MTKVQKPIGIHLFTPGGVKKKRPGKPLPPMVTLYNFKGVIFLNRSAIELMSLSPGDTIAVGRAEAVPQRSRWYITKQTDGFKLSGILSADESKYIQMRFYSADLTQAILGDIGKLDQRLVRLEINPEATRVNGSKSWLIVAPSLRR